MDFINYIKKRTVSKLAELDRFNQAFTGFLLSRGCSEEFLEANEEYREQNRIQNELYKQFKAYLPAENKDKKPHDILRDCIDNNTFIVSLGVQSGYRQGFAEGMKFILSTLMLEH